MLHALLCTKSFFTVDHFNKCMAFVDVDNTRLYSAICGENRTKVIFVGSTSQISALLYKDVDLKDLRYSTDKESPAVDYTQV